MFALVYAVDKKEKLTVDLGKIYEVTDDKNTKRVPYQHDSFHTDKRYFFEEGEFMRRVYILQTAGKLLPKCMLS